MKALFTVANLFWAVVTLALVVGTVVSVVTGMHPLLSLVCGLLALGFGSFAYRDVKSALGK